MAKFLKSFYGLDELLPEYVRRKWNGTHVGLRLTEALRMLAGLPVANGTLE
jgi:hypothetical protein